jgi:hypothetical protein
MLRGHREPSNRQNRRILGDSHEEALGEAPWPTPIGVATCVGVNIKGQAVWTLNVRDADVPGQWIVVNRAFTRTGRGPARPTRPDA